MEIQKIINLLGESDDELLKFATRKWYIITIKTMVSMEKEMKMTQLLNLIQNLLNQISVTIQMPIFL